VQEVAFTLANGLTYVQSAIDRGMDVNAFGPRLSFFFNSHNNFLEEIAKFRAARRLWARLMRERFKANDKACMLRFHTQTGGSTLTAQQIKNNLVRVAFQALAAVLGGTQSLHTNGMDEALALPTEDAARLALRTQQIIGFESGVTNTVDPVGGSIEIEKMTDDIEAQARDYITKIDDMGGSVAAIEAGYIQNEIQTAAYQYQQAIESGEQSIVGVNKHISGGTEENVILKVDASLGDKQRQRLDDIRKKRDNTAVKKTLSALETAAKGSENLMPYIIDAVRSYASLGEIAGTMRNVFGEYHEASSI